MSLRSRTSLVPLLALLALAAACGIPGGGVPEKTPFAESLGIDLAQMTRTESGLYFLDEVVGTGTEARSGSRAYVHYTLYLADGRKMDSSVGGSPLDFYVDRGQVIDGFNEGVKGMHMGGKRRLVLPSELGYGSEGAGSIPANAVLIFDVELVQVY